MLVLTFLEGKTKVTSFSGLHSTKRTINLDVWRHRASTLVSMEEMFLNYLNCREFRTWPTKMWTCPLKRIYSNETYDWYLIEAKARSHCISNLKNAMLAHKRVIFFIYSWMVLTRSLDVMWMWSRSWQGDFDQIINLLSCFSRCRRCRNWNSRSMDSQLSCGGCFYSLCLCWILLCVFPSHSMRLKWAIHCGQGVTRNTT